MIQSKTTATEIPQTKTSVRSIDYGKKGTTGFVGNTTIRGGSGSNNSNPSAYSVPAPSQPSGELSTETYIGEVKDLSPADRRLQSQQRLATIERATLAQNRGEGLYASDTGLLFRGKPTDAYTPFYAPVKEDTSPNKFGGTSVVPTDTSIIGKTGMLTATSYEYVKQNVLPSDEYINKFFTFAEQVNPVKFSGVGVGGIGIYSKEESIFKAGAEAGITKDIKQQPITYIGSYAIGGLIGGGLKLAGAGVGLIAGAKGLTYYEAGLTSGGLLLTGKYAYDFGQKFLSPDLSTFERGEIFGTESTKLFLFGKGIQTGMSGIQGAYDVYRTRGLKEVNVKEIVAPEYYRGQKYPEIYKGETAGQLQKEFINKISSFGEADIAPRGFSASPNVLRDVAGKGSSEVFGLYTAPRLSPTFLRTGGETKTFSLLFEGVGLTKPTASRITFQDIELARGVKAGQSSFRTYDKSLMEQFGGGTIKRKGKIIKVFDYGEPTLQKGKAYLTFIKSEKEAIVPFGTELNVQGRTAFFKFEGRRILVESIKTFEGESKIKTPKGFQKISAEDYGKVLSSRSYESKGSSIINPITISSRALSSSSKPFISRGSIPSSSNNSTSRLLKSFTSSTPVSSPTSSPSSSSYAGRISSGRVSETFTSYVPPYRQQRKKQQGYNFDTQLKKLLKEQKRKGGKEDIAYTPSFTAQVLGIKNYASKSKIFNEAGRERTGAEIRGVLIAR